LHLITGITSLLEFFCEPCDFPNAILGLRQYVRILKEVAITIERLSKEERLVILLSGPSLEGDFTDLYEDLLNGINWNLLLRFSDIARTSPVVYKNLRSLEGIPEDVKESLRLRYIASLSHNLCLKEEIRRIIDSLRDRGIEAIPLKGPVASEHIFGDIALYTSSDIDILVRPQDLSETKRILMDSGYRQVSGFYEDDYIRTGYHLPPYTKNGFYLEVHWNLTMRYFDTPPDFWWEDVEMVDLDGDRYMMLSPERYLLYGIFRLFSHAFYPLKFHFFVAGLISFYQDRIDQELLLSYSRRFGMERLVRFTLSLMRDLFGSRVFLSNEKEGIVSRRIKGMIIRGLFDEEPVLTRRMIVYASLQDSLMRYLFTILERLFPDSHEIRARYSIEPGSKRVILYYLLNPFYLLSGRFRRSP
jgi:hypothetical protein